MLKYNKKNIKYMIASYLLALTYNILYCVLLYFIGEVLSNPTKLRLFLGLNSPNEDPNSFASTTELVQTIGLIVKLIAIFGAIKSIF
jgi:hypothetical protein